MPTKFISTLAALAALAFGVSPLVGCGSSLSRPTTPDQPRLTIGFKQDLPGLSQEVGGHFEGFEVTMTEALLKTLNRQYTAVTVNQADWQASLTDPTSQSHVDLVIAAISDRDSSQAPGISFARSYLKTDLGALTLSTKNLKVAQEGDLRPLSVCVTTGTTAAAEMAALKSTGVVQADGSGACLDLLKAGKVDAFVDDRIILQSLVIEHDKDPLLLADADFGKPQYYAIAMKAGNPLCEPLVQALKTYIHQGDWADSLKNWLGLKMTKTDIINAFSAESYIDDKQCYPKAK
ncbi:transporter substrate-binding domain-containing protein [Catenulispora subtropica]|uniref:Solute-binding protein family 3/N-terminal domain-containing protein n=1 Tax=Catenulispora subtropica TaxID=450798 RepID=A0ABN2SBL7_9ACTN